MAARDRYLRRYGKTNIRYRTRQTCRIFDVFTQCKARVEFNELYAQMFEISVYNNSILKQTFANNTAAVNKQQTSKQANKQANNPNHYGE